MLKIKKVKKKLLFRSNKLILHGFLIIIYEDDFYESPIFTIQNISS
jgi:hypothetical protein